MLAGLRRRAGPRWQRMRTAAPDSGFTLIEVIVAIVLVGIIMTSLTTFFITTLKITSQQGNKQTAVQVAENAMGQVRALNAANLVQGRGSDASDVQWKAIVNGTAFNSASVAPYLSDSVMAFDSLAAATAGATAPLPTSPRLLTVNGIAYGQNWYLGRCWQPLTGGACGPVNTAGFAQHFRVIIAVTWPDRYCGGTVCTYITSSLVSSANIEPLFNTNLDAKPPVVTEPTATTGEVGVPVNVVLAVTDGTPPYIWQAADLPPGVVMDSSGAITGTPTEAGDYSSIVTVTDLYQLADSATIDWTINPLPTLATPPAQKSTVSAAASLQVTRAGGTAPYTWTASGLPTGLSISSTGLISGTPTTAGVYASAKATVTDRYSKAASVTFTWTINAAPALTTPPTQVSTAGAAESLQMQVVGGTTPYTWEIYPGYPLPTGLSINATTGLISGTPTQTGSRTVVVYLTDASGATDYAYFTWTVNAAPTLATPPSQAGTKDTPESLAFTVVGGTGPFVWTASGLPTGLTINASTGTISGTPTVAAVYPTARVTVTDANGKAAVVTFSWTINANLTITTPAARTNVRGTAITAVQVVYAGGTAPYSFSAVNLPPGLVISSTGRITGTPTTRNTTGSSVRITVTDSAGATATTGIFLWKIT